MIGSSLQFIKMIDCLAALLFSSTLCVDASSGALTSRLEQELLTTAHQLGAKILVVDRPLTRATEQVLALLPPSGRPPSALVQAALWQMGIAEPTPHMIVATADVGDDAALIQELNSHLRELLPTSHYSRMAVALRARSGVHDVLVALQESFVLIPAAKSLMAAMQPLNKPIALGGSLVAPYLHPEVFVTFPQGQVVRQKVVGDASRFSVTVACTVRGRYQVEVVGEDRFGSSVLANFPLYCGVAPVNEVAVALQTLGPLVDRNWAQDEIEREIALLVNRDRSLYHLAPLVLDARLGTVARAHSADMRDHHFIGHLSPTTGSAGDRLRKAHIETALVLENIAREYGPSEVEHGLMDSPGHRKNLLDPSATLLGVGAVPEPGGEWLVTQLMVRPPDRLVRTSSADLADRIAQLRRSHGLQTPRVDEALSAIAQRAADAWVARSLSSAEAGALCNQEVARLGKRFASARSLVESAGTLAQLVSEEIASLYEASWDTFGLGVAEGQRNGSTVLFAVLVLAKRR